MKRQSVCESNHLVARIFQNHLTVLFISPVIMSLMLEFFIDGLGLLHVGSCDDVIVNHATKIKLPWGQSESDKAYAKFRYPPASSDATRTKNGLLYFKNRFQCLTRNWIPTSPSYPSFCLPLPKDISFFPWVAKESLWGDSGLCGLCCLRCHFPHFNVGKKKYVVSSFWRGPNVITLWLTAER